MATSCTYERWTVPTHVDTGARRKVVWPETPQHVVALRLVVRHPVRVGDDDMMRRVRGALSFSCLRLWDN
jgi:hypothetical protein